MNEPRQAQWQKILQITQQMRELAVPNEALTDLSVDEEYAKQPWLAITELEITRSDLLNEFFSQQVATEEVIEIQNDIKKIQKIDKELFSISQNIQQKIGSTFIKLGDAQRAVTAYSKVKSQS